MISEPRLTMGPKSRTLLSRTLEGPFTKDSGEQLLERFRNARDDFRFNRAVRLLGKLGSGYTRALHLGMSCARAFAPDTQVPQHQRLAALSDIVAESPSLAVPAF